jgi:hypothetical protein
MPVYRKPIRLADAIKDPKPDRFPARIVVYCVIRDESGSMKRWRQRQGEFIPAVAAHLLEVGGPRVGDLVFILTVIVSGGAATLDFAPLNRAADPRYEPDGRTPIGGALKLAAEKCRAFFDEKVFPQETSVRNFEVLIVSDLQATGESEEETEAGVRDFVDLMEKYNGKVTLVGPEPAAMNKDLAGRLDVSGRGVKYLDSDPKAVLNVMFDSLVAASRPALGGSNPSIRIR